ncbi:SDR family oxidoreductase [Oceanispirochaeta sp.]|jgi:3-dehydrosphinganine reductase|uniref:SDR family oxidoreductase n=1 Tax=Oceanispirochaeta sp. TaxID=2035350 RepID=UPI00262D422E|nr:SDR family oxidoreductase [Oceanispirochaeta sp.]MDA3959073.1 SDR family oxidoreductase [Oceanispirochaeta sp.]
MKNNVVVITGGSSGIGKALAAEFVQKGAHVIIGSRREDVLRETTAELITLSVRKDQRIDFHTLDVTDSESISAFINYIIDSFKKIDVLVNSAGFALCKEIEKTTLEEIENQNESNYLGVIRMIKAVVPSMMIQESGHIINIASMAGIMGVYGYTGYSPSKFAVVGLSDVLRIELQQFGIRVSVVLPPDTDTYSYHHENLTKPLITHKISGTVKLMQPEVLAAHIMMMISKGSYRIIPGVSSKVVYHLNRLFPDLLYWYSRQIIRKVS